MVPDVTIRFIRTVAVVTASHSSKTFCYCLESFFINICKKQIITCN